MIAAQDHRQTAVGERALRQGRQAAAGFRNFAQIFRAFLAVGLLLGLFHNHIAHVFYLVPQLLQPGLQTCNAQRGRAHVHAAAALAEVHGNADDADFLRHAICVAPPATNTSRPLR